MLTDCCDADFVVTGDHIDVLALCCLIEILLDLDIFGSAGVNHGIYEG